MELRTGAELLGLVDIAEMADIGSIAPHRARCLEKLRRYPAVAALINV